MCRAVDAVSAFQDTFHGGSGNDILYVVLDDANNDAFEAAIDQTGFLIGLGITTSIETVQNIDGRTAVEAELSGFSWFEGGDLWGLIPAPSVYQR